MKNDKWKIENEKGMEDVSLRRESRFDKENPHVREILKRENFNCVRRCVRVENKVIAVNLL